MTTPSNSGQGVGLSRRAWTRLNRLRTGVGRFGANMLRWGLSTSDCCDCGAEQTAEHITSGRCPTYRPPEGIQGLIDLDDMTRTWLENCALDVWPMCDGTREKKKKKKSGSSGHTSDTFAKILPAFSSSEPGWDIQWCTTQNQHT